ncbi:GNAT family N-acetyltransferase [Frankia sp. R82]|uniref:GNAT family N-acetyltransferase n=1 Tax=Frankia sp. R82 TaxID=2950553 RepID=UPI002042CCFB|nr:GNAT family N-acetyltransferase [Frankia sp. R82]MCM3882622.1 GNAT family N-acetyltransferase [Frankia sp. R82]
MITYVEMTSRCQLRPAPVNPLVAFELLQPGSPLVRSATLRVGSPHRWPSLTWSDGQWAARLADPWRHWWIIRWDGEVAGIAEVRVHVPDEVEIATFGLVPEFVGSGFGGYALTLTTEAAWSIPLPSQRGVRRVWLHTSTLDHPHALPNYLRRGFRPFHVEVREDPTDAR